MMDDLTRNVLEQRDNIENQRNRELNSNREEYIKQLQQENTDLKKQLEYLRSGEYLNQLKFERNMLEDIVQNMEVSKEDKEFIDMTHRNTELLEENQALKDRINKVLDEILKDKMEQFDDYVIYLLEKYENIIKEEKKGEIMSSREVEEQLKSLVEAWDLDEACLNATDIEAIKHLMLENQMQHKEISRLKEEYVLLQNASDKYEDELKDKINKVINDIEITIQIISEQPSRNVKEDNYILSRLESFINLLKEDNKETGNGR